MSTNVLTGRALKEAHERFFLAYMTLERQACKGDVTRTIYLALVSAENLDIIHELRVTAEEMVELVIKSLERSIARYTNRGMPKIADIFSRRKIEFERRIKLSQLSRPVGAEDLKSILYDLLSIRIY